MALYNMVVMVVDKKNPESDFKDSKQPKAGDVVDILPADAFLGKAIYQDDHNFWRVLQVDMPDIEVTAFKIAEPGDPKVNLLLQYRAFFVDLTLLPQDALDAIAQNPKAPIPVPFAAVLSAKTVRPVRIASAVIG